MNNVLYGPSYSPLLLARTHTLVRCLHILVISLTVFLRMFSDWKYSPGATWGRPSSYSYTSPLCSTHRRGSDSRNPWSSGGRNPRSSDLKNPRCSYFPNPKSSVCGIQGVVILGIQGVVWVFMGVLIWIIPGVLIWRLLMYSDSWFLFEESYKFWFQASFEFWFFGLSFWYPRGSGIRGQMVWGRWVCGTEAGTLDICCAPPSLFGWVKPVNGLVQCWWSIQAYVPGDSLPHWCSHDVMGEPEEKPAFSGFLLGITSFYYFLFVICGIV